jgi:hypothetical protein
MSSTIMEATATWMPVEHPAASPYVLRARLLPVSPRLRGEVCSQAGGGTGLTGAPGGEPFGSGPAGGGLAGRMGLTLRDAVSGARVIGLPVHRTADLALTADVDRSADFASTSGFASTAIQQGAFLAGADVPTVPTTPVPTTTVPTTTVRNETTTVRNEKKQEPGPSVLRPPL